MWPDGVDGFWEPTPGRHPVGREWCVPGREGGGGFSLKKRIFPSVRHRRNWPTLMLTVEKTKRPGMRILDQTEELFHVGRKGW